MGNELDIVALVPARSGSKGIKDKNILPLGGHPLISFSIIVAKQSELINEVYVTTDSKKYCQVSESYGAVIPFLRPAEISNDLSTKSKVQRRRRFFFRQSFFLMP